MTIGAEIHAPGQPIALDLERGRVLLGREEKVEGRAGGVHRPIQVAPLAFDPYVGLVHPPTVVGRFEPRAQTSFHFRGVTLHPSPHRDMVDPQTTLGEQLRDLSIGERKTQVPADREQDHLRLKLAPPEQSGNRWGEEHRPSLSGQTSKLATLPIGCSPRGSPRKSSLWASRRASWQSSRSSAFFTAADPITIR